MITIHQPEHLPWLGFFDKVLRSDLLVVLDSVQFRKNYFQNRNRIRTAAGWSWVTIPVRRHVVRPIHEVQVDATSPALRRYVSLVRENYRRAPYFDRYFPPLQALLQAAESSLCRLNVALLRFAFEHLEVDTPFILSSSLGLPPTAGPHALNLAVCRRIGASRYLSGPAGRTYLDLDAFRTQGIEVEFHEFAHPVYLQRHEPFLPGMSVVDLLFNHGPESAGILRRARPVA